MNVHFDAIRLHKVIDTDLLRAILNNTRDTHSTLCSCEKNLFYTFCPLSEIVVSNLFSHFQASSHIVES